MNWDINTNINLVPVSLAAVLSFLSGWCSAALGSSLSTYLREPGRGPFLPGLNELPLVSPSSCQTSGCATFLHDSLVLLSCAAPSASPPALQPVSRESHLKKAFIYVFVLHVLYTAQLSWTIPSPVRATMTSPGGKYKCNQAADGFSKHTLLGSI